MQGLQGGAWSAADESPALSKGQSWDKIGWRRHNHVIILGPAQSGTRHFAAALSKKLGYTFVDSGGCTRLTAPKGDKFDSNGEIDSSFIHAVEKVVADKPQLLPRIHTLPGLTNKDLVVFVARYCPDVYRNTRRRYVRSALSNMSTLYTHAAAYAADEATDLMTIQSYFNDPDIRGHFDPADPICKIKQDVWVKFQLPRMRKAGIHATTVTFDSLKTLKGFQGQGTDLISSPCLLPGASQGAKIPTSCSLCTLSDHVDDDGPNWNCCFEGGGWYPRCEANVEWWSAGWALCNGLWWCENDKDKKNPVCQDANAPRYSSAARVPYTRCWKSVEAKDDRLSENICELCVNRTGPCDCLPAPKTPPPSACRMPLQPLDAKKLHVAVFGNSAARTYYIGLVNQLTELSHHIGYACEQNASIVMSGVFPTFLSQKYQVDLSVLLNVRQLNLRLSRMAGCQYTQVLQRGCIKAMGFTDENYMSKANVTCMDTVMPHLFTSSQPRSILADEVLSYFEPRSPSTWSLMPKFQGVDLSAGYDAVHLDLDADRLIFMKRGVDFYYTWKDKSTKEHQRDVLNSCCVKGANASYMETVNTALSLFKQAIQQCFKRGKPLPVVIATSMGKGYTQGAVSDWILEDFKASMPEITFVLGFVHSPWRELAAAAELRVVSQARNFVGSFASTFSRFAASRVTRNGGRVALIDFLPDDSPLREYDHGQPPPPLESDMLGNVKLHHQGRIMRVVTAA